MEHILLLLISLIEFVVFAETFPEEIMSQGETAVRVYLSSCSEGSAVNVFLRVDVVGRDGVGKTSLTKSLTLQKFNPDEPSTIGVVFDPKCQIIVKEACDWTKPLTSADYAKIYEKNVVINMAEALDTPEVKDQYFKSKESEHPRRQKYARMTKKSSKQESRVQNFPVAPSRRIARSMPHVPHSGFSLTVSSQKATTLAVRIPAQSVPSGLSSSSQPSSNSSAFKDPNVLSHVTVTDAKSSDSAAVVAEACSSSDQIEADFRNVDNLVGDEGDRKFLVSGFSFDLQSSQEIKAVNQHGSMAPSKIPLMTSFSCDSQQQPQQKKHKNKDETPSERSLFCNLGSTGYYAALDHETMSPNKKTQPIIASTDVQSCKYQHRQQQSLNKRKQPEVQAFEKPLFRSVDDSSTENTTTIPQHLKESVSKSLRDPKSRQKAKKEIMLTVLDYAGQNVFYVTHHLFMSKAGFMYVVFDACQPMDGKTPSQFRSEDGQIVHIPLFDDETNFDRLEEWVSGVHIMEGDQSRRIMIFEKVGIRSPVMFLVGTHVDKLKEQPGMVEKQDAFIRKKLEGTVLAEHIIWASKDMMCFYVDNTLTDPDSGVVDPQVTLLRQKTEEVAHKVARHHRLPISWLKYEQNVREVKVSYPTKRTTTVDELLQLAMKAAGIKDREELLVLLRYLSSRAVLMYHPKALKSGDEEEVVLDVEWFVSQLQKVITIHMEGDVPPMFWNDVKRSKEKGIMTMSLVRHLLSDAGGSAQRLIVSLMSHYDLLCEYPVIEEEDLDKASDCNDFLSLKGEREGQSCNEERDVFERQACFVPCLLEHAVGLESDKMNDEQKSLPLILSSAPIRVPQPLFYRVLTLLCKRFRRLAVIYRNVGYFHIYPGHRLEFALNRYNFQMTVLSDTVTPPNSKVCGAVREWIVNIVDKAKQQGMAGLKLRLGFLQNALTSISSISNAEFISLDGYQRNRYSLYSRMTKTEVQPSTRLYLWYPQLECSVSSFHIVILSLSELVFSCSKLMSCHHCIIFHSRHNK